MDDFSKYRVAYSRDRHLYGVGRDHLIHDDFSIFEIHAPGYVFADHATAQRFADDLNITDIKENTK